jgi:hypothetical protein
LSHACNILKAIGDFFVIQQEIRELHAPCFRIIQILCKTVAAAV